MRSFMTNTALNAATSRTIDKPATRRLTARNFLAHAQTAVSAFSVEPINEFKSYCQNIYVCVEKPIQQPESDIECFPVSLRLETILHDSAAYETFENEQAAELFAVELQRLINETECFVEKTIYINKKIVRNEF
jgi:hypothetical protein